MPIKKGSINIILVIIVVALVGAGAYFVSTRQITPPVPNPTLTPTPNPSPTPTPVSNHINWDRNKEYFYYYENEKILLTFVGIKNGYPVFMTQNSKGEMFLTDEFIVKIKDGVSRKDLEVLNSKHNVSILKQNTADNFVLKVGDSRSNALDMANAYHGEIIIEWATPNFIEKFPWP